MDSVGRRNIAHSGADERRIYHGIETIKMRTEAADILRELQDDPKVRNNDIVVGILKDAELECYREERQDRSKYTPKTRKNNPNRAQGVNDG